MGTAEVPLTPASTPGGTYIGDDGYVFEEYMDDACYGAFDRLFADGDYPDLAVDGKVLSYDPDPNTIGGTYHVVWVRLVSSITSWESSAGPGSAHGSGSISVTDSRSWHLDGYVVDHSAHASVQYMMVPGMVPLENLADLPDVFVPDMDGIYRLNYSNLLPNRTTVLDVDADVPYHDVGLVNAVDPYPGEKAWFLDPECTMRFDFGSTPIT